MSKSEQPQLPVEVKMLDGSTRYGVHTGNNAAWHCECGQQLVGTAFFFRKPVVCRCGNAYQVWPKEGVPGREVDCVWQLQMKATATITLDGKKVPTAPGETIWSAAKRAGVDIP
ncbi:MAG: (2Fe-2S)-binding protein, partial [Gammaproteobacteria bacterium]|nr:(2Fe-2S)-binding protein [Gammaproteobacteria bacterium]